ncbi:MAG: hypothetical protein AAFN09_04570 [Pseudomonadota bacterium]
MPRTFCRGRMPRLPLISAVKMRHFPGEDHLHCALRGVMTGLGTHMDFAA